MGSSWNAYLDSSSMHQTVCTHVSLLSSLLLLVQILCVLVQEPPLGDFKGQPQCIADQQTIFTKDPRTLTGTLFRVPSCEILYGPLNCAFVLTGENW